MKSTMLIAGFCITVALLPGGCRTNGETTQVNQRTAWQDTVLKWEQYMESSAEGLWEDSVRYELEIERLHLFGGEDNPAPPFFDPLFVHVSGDTLFVTDEASQSLVCMDTTGTVLWRFGESGEGPGYFAAIGQVDVMGDTIAVINNGLSFIELLNRDGSMIGRLSAVERPMDISFAGSTDTLLVFSKRQAGGDVHLVDVQADSILASFGDGEWETYPNSGSYASVWGVFLSPDSVAYMGQYESKLVFCRISDRSSSWVATRELPFEITECTNYYDEETNTFRGTAYSRHVSLCVGPHGELDMVFFNLMQNGEMARGQNTFDRPPVSVIDRFDRNGNYLDSYCLPDSAINRIYYNGNGYMAAIQRNTGTIFGYRIETAD